MIDFPFTPDSASTIAGRIDLTTLTLILLSAFFTSIVLILIIWFGIKYRRGNEVDRSNPPSGNTRMELGWIGGLFFLSIGVFAWATLTFYRINRPPADTLDIYVVGKQWMWKIAHPEGPSEINTLHVPRGRSIRLVMISQDVIHSFYVPAFRLKQDVLPGRYTYLWFEPTRAGEYHLFCAEYCGTEHSTMRGTIVVMEPHEYQQWLSDNSTGQPLTEDGEQLYAQLGCANCHTEGAGTLAPTLEGLFGESVPLADGTSVQADENYILESIYQPNAKIVAGYNPIMPTYEGQITEEQALQLVSYIQSLGGEE